MPIHAPRSFLKSGEKSEERFGIPRSIGSGSERGFVAGFLGHIGKAAMQPPTERAEPEDGAVQERKALGKRVAANDVREFVGDHGVKRGRVPFAPFGRK